MADLTGCCEKEVGGVDAGQSKSGLDLINCKSTYLDIPLVPDDILGGVLALHHLGPVHRHHERGEARVVSDVQPGPRTQQTGYSVSLNI